ncbi:RNA polymerase sigma factor [Faecalispora anaeroviscerum]|uniref:RNA polymerase sigma factor n=1 Tax=Faecalispora anaeroviscerum TaxID=2991836 RepID=UPI0024BB983A|nr:RNA polymerase sigma factor [Faecalispora anaeroviscerum]
MEAEQLSSIVEQAKNQDVQAITQLYEEYHNGLYFLCLKIVKNEDDALDLVQDSFLQAFDKLETLQNTERFGSWLNQIAANKCRDYLKKKKPLLFSQKQGDEDGAGEEFEIEDRNETLIPDQSLDTQETRRLIMQIIDALPDLQRMTVMLYYYEEKPVSEIAEIMECSENTVKSRLNYARKQIRAGVLELEQKGTKLYGAMPMLFPLIQNAAAGYTMPAGTSASMLGSITSFLPSQSSVSTISSLSAKTLPQKLQTVLNVVKSSSLPVKAVSVLAAAAIVTAAGANLLNHDTSIKTEKTVSSVAVQTETVDETVILKNYLDSLPSKTEFEVKGYPDEDNMPFPAPMDYPSIQVPVTKQLLAGKIIDFKDTPHKQLVLKYQYGSTYSGKLVTMDVYSVVKVVSSKAQKSITETSIYEDTIESNDIPSDGEEPGNQFTYSHVLHCLMDDFSKEKNSTADFALYHKERVLKHRKTNQISILWIEGTDNPEDDHYYYLKIGPNGNNISAEDKEGDDYKKLQATLAEYDDITDQIK